MALIAVTWTVLLLSIFAAGALALSLSMRQTVSSVEQDVKDRLLAQSAATLFMKEYFYDPVKKAFRGGGLDVLGTHVDVEVEYETGKININRASYDVLSALFAAEGEPADDAYALAARIIDWRDKDDIVFGTGAEQAEYEAAGLTVGPRNGPFEKVGELKYLLGLPDQTFNCVEPLLTVSSLNGDVDLSYAGQNVRQVYKWAYDNKWNGVVWPNPDTINVATEVAGTSNTIGGQSLTLKLSFTSDGVSKTYRTTLRFKSTADMSYAMLSPVQKDVTINVNGCPFA
ncbi:general secretion pathway protein GspK [Kordiimonas marina]|uniref:general secretion pathway protein GspK n=1 Tax=Kordiimonas marina TaxID=2872312 RepID=UPI001FF1EC46|nr:type II secretion system protein GspK [Kordiimonas marina]MCJ9430032.1 general secretion pathway protein GspK [Kordiimonas marina]